ncbi:hypothetical protein [Nocardioides lijunqiniae]|uniref:hypothetical protein n=1 Tax=Nocardioides lijunqiniae TaxID=2760832 RepID=UPI0018783DE1|nr:hypothetical protein [Nocardioides lijunqiniae]
MNDDSTSTLQRAASRLEPDVDRLVAGGTARGRRLRRRRRVGGGITAAAVVGLVAAGVAVVPQVLDGGASPRGGAAASDPTPTPTPDPTTPTAPTRRPLAVTQAQVPATFAELFPGQVTELPAKEVVDEAPIVDFRWNGFGVRVGITPAEYSLPYSVDTGEQIGTAGGPRKRCRTGGLGGCVPGPDGSWVATYVNTGPAVDGGVSSRFVTVYTADGWDVMVVSHNAASSKGSELLADEPPFTVAQLKQAALSGIWFD